MTRMGANRQTDKIEMIASMRPTLPLRPLPPRSDSQDSA
jgi:hypothetical protein